jgi:hypothetical protein
MTGTSYIERQECPECGAAWKKSVLEDATWGVPSGDIHESGCPKGPGLVWNEQCVTVRYVRERRPDRERARASVSELLRDWAAGIIGGQPNPGTVGEIATRIVDAHGIRQPVPVTEEMVERAWERFYTTIRVPLSMPETEVRRGLRAALDGGEDE